MKTVTSKDGTTIAYDQVGTGPTVIIVDGALQYRAFDQGNLELSNLLAPHFTAIHYDRRGRGDSGDSTDTQPFAVEREIEDIDALIAASGGSAYLYGISSGGALAMEAAIALGPNKVRKLVMYEAPYNSEPEAQATWREYVKNLNEAIATGKPGDAVGLFMMLVGMPEEHLPGMKQDPMWPLFESVGNTLAYDAAALGDGSAVPTEKAARVTVPTLLMAGSQTYPFMHVAAETLAKAMPQGQYRVLEGQSHEVSSEALAPVLIEFFQA